MHVLRRLRRENESCLPELRWRASAAPAAKKSMIHEALEKIIAEKDLTRAEADAAMERILCGQASDLQIACFLTALRMKGETVDELVGFATAMRRHATPNFSSLRPPPGEALVDTAGTGGDARGTFNISTAA